MSFKFQRNLNIAVVLLAFVGATQQVCGQSGSRTTVGNADSLMQGSGTAKSTAPVALSGYCPVCVLEMKKWVKGDTRFTVVQDGKTYLFPGEEQKQMFLKNPGKYTPALGGNCTVCLVEMGKGIEGSLQFTAIHDGRLFLFPGADQKQMFLANPAKYATADLAANGNCSVCRVEMQQDVQGKPEFSAIYKGMRYLFPSDEQRKMFVGNPAKYEVK